MTNVKAEKDKRRTVPNTGKRYSEDFLGFVDIDLTDADKDALQEAFGAGHIDLLGFVLQVVLDGYKLSLVEDVEHHTCIATVTGKAAACPNRGFALSGRGPGPLEALGALWYKVSVVAHWGVWVEEGGRRDQQLPLWG